MQIFATSPSFSISAKVLDSRRMNKQVIECNQIYRALIGESIGWRNHCVTRLWSKYPLSVIAFGWACFYELKSRGLNPCQPCVNPDDISTIYDRSDLVPPFLWDKKMTDAMKSHLLAKDFPHYSQFGWKVPIKRGYYALDRTGRLTLYSTSEPVRT